MFVVVWSCCLIGVCGGCFVWWPGMCIVVDYVKFDRFDFA